MKYVCELCGLVYDEQVGDPKRGVRPGTAFADAEKYDHCPACGAEREAFTILKARQIPANAAQGNAEFWKAAKYSDGHSTSDR